MKYVSATEAKERFAEVLQSAQQEPVTVRSYDRDVAVVLSLEDWQRLKGTNLEEQAELAALFSQRPVKV